MSLGFLLLILWVFVFDMDLIVGILMLALSGWFGGDLDDAIVEKLETVPHEQVIKADHPIDTSTLSSKETCEAEDGVWVPEQNTCY